MSTDCLFREDAYLTECRAEVVGHTEQGGIVVDRTVFYATSGGQPGDRGTLTSEGGVALPIAGAVYTDPAKTVIAQVPADAAAGRPANRWRSSSTGTCATGACACTRRCTCSPPCCPIR